MTHLTCFKAYDIRGQVPEQLNDTLVYRIGRAFASLLKAKKVVIGRDIRPTGLGLSQALIQGLRESGSDVYDIGLSGTEEVYYATFAQKMDGGIMITASHNPQEYNGLKLVKEQAIPLSSESGLQELEKLVQTLDFFNAPQLGNLFSLNIKENYKTLLLSFINQSTLKPLKIVVNAGNGMAGPIIDQLEPHLPFEFIKVHHQPDGNFPHGIPNPLLSENRLVTQQAIRLHQADLGVAWDGDGDRCFLFDEQGQCIEGYYLVGLLAQYFLKRESGAKIIYDPRLTWNIIETVTQHGGIALQNKAGHAFFKTRLRQENAVYGGEMSGHHYFRDFGFCDSGMIPWLLITEILSTTQKKLSELVADYYRTFPASGEINYSVSQSQAVLAQIKRYYEPSVKQIDQTDGLSMEFEQWRFNLRASNTEPLLRLNVETKANRELLEQKIHELGSLIQQYA